MRTVVNKNRMASASALAAVSVVTLTAAWALGATESARPTCNDPRLTNEAVLDCVADRAAETSSTPAAFLLTVVGIAGFGAALLLGAAAVRPVLTLKAAAEELDMPTSRVRELVEEGTLDNRSTDRANVYLDPEQVRHIRSHPSAEVAAGAPTEGG